MDGVNNGCEGQNKRTHTSIHLEKGMKGIHAGSKFVRGV